MRQLPCQPPAIRRVRMWIGPLSCRKGIYETLKPETAPADAIESSDLLLVYGNRQGVRYQY